MCIYIMYIYINVSLYKILCIILYANHMVRSASEVVAPKQTRPVRTRFTGFTE